MGQGRTLYISMSGLKDNIFLLKLLSFSEELMYVSLCNYEFVQYGGNYQTSFFFLHLRISTVT